MLTSARVKELWRLVGERSAAGQRLRRRLRVIGAVALALCSFLILIGLARIVLAFFLGMLVTAAVLVLVALWPRLRPRFAALFRGARSRSRSARVSIAPLVHRAQVSSRAASAVARSHTSTLTKTALESSRKAARELHRASSRIDPQHEALRLNAAGTQHRRNGDYDTAVECHRRALEILRGLGDRRAVALTQSNLALALSHGADDAWAIGLFEDAAAILRDLGDSEREAQVMANLGLVHRRHGRREEANNVLQLALTKLNPSSRAYHTIEAELRRAS